MNTHNSFLLLPYSPPFEVDSRPLFVPLFGVTGYCLGRKGRVGLFGLTPNQFSPQMTVDRGVHVGLRFKGVGVSPYAICMPFVMAVHTKRLARSGWNVTTPHPWTQAAQAPLKAMTIPYLLHELNITSRSPAPSPFPPLSKLTHVRHRRSLRNASSSLTPVSNNTSMFAPIHNLPPLGKDAFAPTKVDPQKGPDTQPLFHSSKPLVTPLNSSKRPSLRTLPLQLPRQQC